MTETSGGRNICRESWLPLLVEAHVRCVLVGKPFGLRGCACRDLSSVCSRVVVLRSHLEKQIEMSRHFRTSSTIISAPYMEVISICKHFLSIVFGGVHPWAGLYGLGKVLQ